MSTEILSDKSVVNEKNRIVSRNKGYSDLDLKLRQNPLHGDIVPLRDLAAVKQSVKNLILTSKKERLFQPWLGSGVRDLLFEPNTSITIGSLKQEMYRVIEKYEPRVSINYINITNNDDTNTIFVSINFTVINLTDDVSVEFYIERVR
jgi:phage baseplate assembly protein W|tara:strand:+ start:12636 stop:13079 length:444 start_codon:yes stop_codon:yes gene_type:complete